MFSVLSVCYSNLLFYLLQHMCHFVSTVSLFSLYSSRFGIIQLISRDLQSETLCVGMFVFKLCPTDNETK